MITTARVAADPADGYCDYVEGTAAARSALLSAPELIGSIGYGRDPGFADPAVPLSAGTRVTAGVGYKLSAILEGSYVRARARPATEKLCTPRTTRSPCDSDVTKIVAVATSPIDTR